jgi:hypothetical protein
VVVADTYELSGGSVGGSVEFADLFALSGSGVAQGELRGDGDASRRRSESASPVMHRKTAENLGRR